MKKILLQVLSLIIVGTIIFLILRVQTVKQNSAEVEIQNGIPIISTVPDFSFENYDGTHISKQSLKGNFWLIDFIFTTCPGQCPMMTKAMVNIQDRYKNSANFKLVSVTVDPEIDSRETLKRYASSYGALPSQFYFLRGNIDSVKMLAVDGLKLEGNPVVTTHSAYFVLVDPEGNVRGYYHSLEEEGIKKLHSHLDELLNIKT